MVVTGQLERETDEELALHVARGDREAFARLYERHFQPVYDFVARIVRDRDAAADVAQSTFTKVWESSAAARPVRNPRAWLYAVAYNSAIDEVRRRSRSPASIEQSDHLAESDLPAPAPRDVSEPEAQLLEKELAELVWSAAAALSPDEYALLDLHVRRGLDADELAEQLGLRKGALYTRLSRLRRSLEEALTSALLMRRGRRDCSTLDALLTGMQASTLTPEVRRAIQAHLDECRVCQDSKRRYVTAAEIFAGLAPLPLTPGFQDLLWRRISEQLGWDAGGNGAADAGKATSAGPRPQASPLGTRFSSPLGAGARAARALLSLPATKAPLLLVFAAGAVVATIAATLALTLTSGGSAVRDPRYVWSPSHDAGESSTARVIAMRWSRQPGAAGYSILWSHSRSDLPDAVADLPGTATGTTSGRLSPGRWYFTLRTQGPNGKWTSTVHRGPFIIVALPPVAGTPSSEQASAGPSEKPAPAGEETSATEDTEAPTESPAAAVTLAEEAPAESESESEPEPPAAGAKETSGTGAEQPRISPRPKPPTGGQLPPTSTSTTPPDSGTPAPTPVSPEPVPGDDGSDEGGDRGGRSTGDPDSGPTGEPAGTPPGSDSSPPLGNPGGGASGPDPGGADPGAPGDGGAGGGDTGGQEGGGDGCLEPDGKPSAGDEREESCGGEDKGCEQDGGAAGEEQVEQTRDASATSVRSTEPDEGCPGSPGDSNGDEGDCADEGRGSAESPGEGDPGNSDEIDPGEHADDASSVPSEDAGDECDGGSGSPNGGSGSGCAGEQEDGPSAGPGDSTRKAGEEEPAPDEGGCPGDDREHEDEDQTSESGESSTELVDHARDQREGEPSDSQDTSSALVAARVAFDSL